MRKKFKILYSSDHHEEEKRGLPFKPANNEMVVMNSNGVFFIFNGETYYPSIRPLSDVIPKYDVVWN
jgi:hypothetical protein